MKLATSTMANITRKLIISSLWVLNEASLVSVDCFLALLLLNCFSVGDWL